MIQQIRKPIIAVVDCLAASACFWPASQADEIILTPSSEVGSVGCLYLHVDQSQALEQAGIRPTFIHAGRYKVQANSLEPLGDAGHQHLQSEVERVHELFVADIVAGRKRGLTPDRVRKTFGEGRVISAEDAIRRGMADRLFPTIDAALGYAATHASRLSLKRISIAWTASCSIAGTARRSTASLHARQRSTPNWSQANHANLRASRPIAIT